MDLNKSKWKDNVLLGASGCSPFRKFFSGTFFIYTYIFIFSDIVHEIKVRFSTNKRQ